MRRLALLLVLAACGAPDKHRLLERVERLERILPALELTPIKVKRIDGTDHVVWVLMEER